MLADSVCPVFISACFTQSKEISEYGFVFKMEKNLFCRLLAPLSENNTVDPQNVILQGGILERLFGVSHIRRNNNQITGLDGIDTVFK